MARLWIYALTLSVLSGCLGPNTRNLPSHTEYEYTDDATVFTDIVSAEDIFTRIEALIEQAKSLSIIFSYSGKSTYQGTELTSSGRGTLVLKRGGKAIMRVVLDSGNAISFASDGMKMKASGGSFMGEERPAIRGIETAFARLGIVALTNYLDFIGNAASGGGYKDSMNLKERIATTGFVKEKDEGGIGVLKYHIGNTPAFSEAKIWYDTKTFRIIKRIMVFYSEVKKETISESYQEWVMDKDIPDEMFVLPR